MGGSQRERRGEAGGEDGGGKKRGLEKRMVHAATQKGWERAGRGPSPSGGQF